METQATYAKEHEVMLLLKRIIPCLLKNPDTYLKKHLSYYRELNKNKKVLRYGRALTGNSICILLHVLSDNDFESIVSNDPALDKIYELVSIVPFANEL